MLPAVAAAATPSAARASLRLLVPALAAALLALAAPARAEHADLAGQWHLDEASEGEVAGEHPDSSGHGSAGDSHDGTQISGRFGMALGFDGVGGTVRVDPTSATLEPARVTVMAWVRRTGDAPDDFAYLVAKGGQACTASSWALYNRRDGVHFYVYDGTDVHLSPGTGSAFWNDEQWHAVAGTFDGTRVRLYVDGTEVGAGTAVPPGTSIRYAVDDRALTMASYPIVCRTFSGRLRGGIDEVRVYRRALTAGEIRGLQTAPGPAPPELPGASGDGAGGAGGGGGGGGGAGGGPPAGSPVASGVGAPPAIVPRISQAQRAVVTKGAWLSAATSVIPDRVEAAAYEWDFDHDGVYEVPCGGFTPAVTRAYAKAGPQTVGLRITDTLGRAVTARQSITVEPSMVNRAKGAETVFDCSNPGANNQPDREDCIKTFGFSIVSVNSRGRVDDCFEIRARPRLDLLTVDGASAAQGGGLVSYLLAYYHARIRGPVAINGLYVPVPSDRVTEYDSGARTIGAGRLPLRFGGYVTRELDLSQRIEPDRFGRHRLGLPTLKAPDALGFLPVRKLGGHIDLIRHASLSTIVVGLPNVFTYRARGEPAEVAATIRSDNLRGADLDGVQIGPVPELLLGPLTARKLRFAYSRSDGTWRGGGDLGLTGPSPVVLKASPPPPDFGFGLRRGSFWYAGAGADFPVPAARPVLFPGITLKTIGVAVGIQPFRLTGIGGIAVGELIEIDGALFLGFPTPSAPYDFPSEDAGEELGALAGRRLDTTTVALGGTASVRVPGIDRIFPQLDRLQLLKAHLVYQWPGYVEYAGNVELKHKDGYFSIKGGVEAFADAESRTFNLEGKVEACLKKPVSFCAPEVGAVLSSKGLGFCTLVPVPTPFGVVPIPAGAGLRWGASFPDLMVFSCSIGAYREVRPETAQAGQRIFELPAGLPSAMIRVRAAGGAPPRVVLTGPGGQVVRVPAGLEEAFDPRFAVMRVPEDGATLVALKDPAAGRWTVASEPGSPSITGLAVAHGLEEPEVRASVTGRGAGKVLRYAVRGGSGWRIVLAEQGARTSRDLGVVRGARGAIRFRPGEGRGGRRRILARLEAGGRPVRTLVAGSYRARGTGRPGRPRRLRAVSRGTSLAVRWAGVPRAARYAVTLVPRRGAPRLRTTRARSVRFGRLRRGARGRVFVSAMDGGGIAGPEARARWSLRRRSR